jgi:hypothetical protein
LSFIETQNAELKLSMDAIQEAIAAAKAAAGQAVVPQTATSTAVSTEVARGAPLSMTDLMMDGGITVDAWLKIEEHGILIGGKKPFQDDIKNLELDLSSVKPKYSIKYGANPVTYKHTYDHRVSTQGESWANVCLKAAQLDPKAREYRSADIPLVVTEDIPGAKGQDPLATTDQVLGLTLSTTAWRKWESFFNSLVKAGVDVTSTIKVNLGYEVRTGNGNTWGVPTFELVTN